MSKGGASEQTTEVKLPPALEQAAEDNLKIANEVAAIGYTPYQGPSVAGFTPMQQQSFAGTNAAANAFGLPSFAPAGATGADVDPLTGIPLSSMTPQGNYSAFPMYQQAVNAVPAPQRSMIESFITNPETGRLPTNPAVPTPKFAPVNQNTWQAPSSQMGQPRRSAYDEWKERQRNRLMSRSVGSEK